MRGRMGFPSNKEIPLLLDFLTSDVPNWYGVRDAQKCVTIRFQEASPSLHNFLHGHG